MHWLWKRREAWLMPFFLMILFLECQASYEPASFLPRWAGSLRKEKKQAAQQAGFNKLMCNILPHTRIYT